MTDNNVISLQEARLKLAQHETGNAVCTGCKHEWVYVRELPKEGSPPYYMECPSCSRMLGLSKWPYMKDELSGNKSWHLECCECGSDVFRIAWAKGMETPMPYCPSCGTWQGHFLETPD